MEVKESKLLGATVTRQLDGVVWANGLACVVRKKEAWAKLPSMLATLHKPIC